MEYSKPPVVETVLSVQFKPLPDFGAGQLGAYWKGLGPEWPHVVDAPSVEPVFEQFDGRNVWAPAAFVKLSSKIDLRLQIRNHPKDRMIQVQNGRFFYNWLGAPGIEYPSYESVRPEFDDQWKRFREFVIANTKENVVRPNQWEILYVNHLPRGSVWNDLSDLPQALTFLRHPDFSGTSLIPDGLFGEWRFEIPPEKGRLYVKLRMKKPEDKEGDLQCVVLTLTARGHIGEVSPTLNEGLALGHATIRESFDRLTSTEAHKYWGVQYANSRS